MGFTLGKKEYIINDSSQSPIETVGGNIRIKGYGTFAPSQVVVSAVNIGQRFIPETFGKLNIAIVSAADLGVTVVNTPASFKISLSSSRMAAEWGNNYIINSRPFIFELLLDPLDTDAQVADKLTAAFTAYETVFGPLPFTYGGTAPSVDLVAKESHLAFSSNVTVNLPFTDSPIYLGTSTYIYGGVDVTAGGGSTTLTVNDTTGLRVGDKLKDINGDTAFISNIISGTEIEVSNPLADGPVSIRAYTGTEGTVTGKYLEENVRMSLPATTDAYGILTAQKPVLKGGYTEVTFTIKDDWATGGVDTRYKMHAGLGGTRDEAAGQRNHTFTLYFLEGGGGLWGTDGFVEKLIVALEEVADGAAAPVKFSLKLSGGGDAPTIGDFVA